MLDQTDPLELLAQDALVPVRFLAPATGLGPALDPGSSDPDLPAEATLTLPLWLIPELHARRLLDVRLPAVYSERYRRKLNAGAECVSLKSLAPYFYEVGNALNELMRDVELSAFLSRSFKTRYHELISKGLNTMTGEEVLTLSSKLSVEEQQLFEGGRVSITAMERWWRGDARGGPTGPAPAARPNPLLKRAAPGELAPAGGTADAVAGAAAKLPRAL